MANALGIDLGTSSVKVALLDIKTGKRVASANEPSEPMPCHAERPGWCEQDPDIWWQHLREGLEQIPTDARRDVAAIGIAYQMHGLLLLGQNGKALRRSIIWADGRAAATGVELARRISPEDRKSLRNDPGNFTLSKLLWVRENEPELFVQAWKAMLPGDYFAFRMTGAATTTAGGLSEMIAWDYDQDRPHDRIWESAGGSLALRPEIVSTLGLQGRLLPEVARELGLPEGTPISYRAGDQPNNAMSVMALNPGDFAATAGTSGVLFGVSETALEDPDQRVNPFLHVNHRQTAPRIGILFCLNGAGISYSWLRRTLGVASFEELDRLAESSAPGANGIGVLPFGNGAERLLGNRSPGASIHGLDFNRHGREDLARATMEGVLFALKAAADVLAEIAQPVAGVRAGNANLFKSELFRRSFATLIGAELTLVETDGALGAARAAALGAGLFPSWEEAFSSLETVGVSTPDPELRNRLAKAHSSWRGLLMDQPPPKPNT